MSAKIRTPKQFSDDLCVSPEWYGGKLAYAKAVLQDALREFDATVAGAISSLEPSKQEQIEIQAHFKKVLDEVVENQVPGRWGSSSYAYKTL